VLCPIPGSPQSRSRSSPSWPRHYAATTTVLPLYFTLCCHQLVCPSRTLSLSVVVFRCSSPVLVFLYLLISAGAYSSIRTPHCSSRSLSFPIFPCLGDPLSLCFTLTLLVSMVADGSWGVGVGYILGPLSDDRYTHSTHLVCSSLTSFLVPRPQN